MGKLLAILFAIAAGILQACPVDKVKTDRRIRVKQECRDNPLAPSCMP